MSVTTTSFTTNCKKITVIDELSMHDIIDAVNTAITTLGWDFYDDKARAYDRLTSVISSGTTLNVGNTANIYVGDSVKFVSGTGNINTFTRVLEVTNTTHITLTTAPAAGLNSATLDFYHDTNENFTKIYRKINNDGETYKYAIVRYSTLSLELHLSTCESYNSTTKTVTNECWTNSGAFCHIIDIKNMFLLVSASAGHLMFWSYIRNESSLWSGIFEFERAVEDDTAARGIPCWAYTNSLLLGTPWGQGINTTPSRVMFCFPRTADGATGSAAARVYAPVTNRGMYPPSHPNANVATTIDTNLLHLGSYANLTYGWDTSKSTASAIAVDAIEKSMPLGRMFSAGITKSVGGLGDSTYINANSTYGWPEANGTSTEFLLMPLNGGSEIDATWGTGRLANTLISLPSGAPAGNMVSIGNNVWMAAADGVRTASLLSGNGTSTTLQYASSTGPVTGIKFDGRRTIYGCTNTLFFALDTETKAATTTSITDGGGEIGIDNLFVYVSGRTANTRPLIHIFDRINGTYLNFNDAQYLQNAASSVSTQIFVPSTAGIQIGANVAVTGGTGAFAAGTRVISINSPTSFTVSATPTTTLNGANVSVGLPTTLPSTYGEPVPDMEGNIYVATQPGTASSQSMRVGSFTQMPTFVTSAESSGTTVTVEETCGIIRGSRVRVTNGTGEVTSTTVVENVTSPTTFTLSEEPVTPLNGARLLIDMPLLSCNSSGNLITISNANAAGLNVGAPLRLVSGTGTLAAGTKIIQVVNATAFRVTSNPSVTLNQAELASEPLVPVLNFINPKKTTAIDQRPSPTKWYIDRWNEPRPRPYLVVCDTTTGTIYEYNSYGTQLQAVNFTTNSTAANLYSNRLPWTNLVDYAGDLAITKFRGVFLISPKRPGTSVAGGFVSRIVFDHPQGASVGGVTFTNVNNTIRVDGTPLGYTNVTHSDGIALYSSISPSTTDHRLYYITGLYGLTAYNGTSLGRFLIKA